MTGIDRGLLAAIEAVTAKRPRTVLDHILEHGYVTTEQLRDEYGYDHPPRAARDVREAGIPLETFKVKGAHGRFIGAYRLGDPGKVEAYKLAGRRTFPKTFKKQLYYLARAECQSCGTPYEERYLQIDHRIPYEVAGEVPAELDLAAFMLLCSSCQRSKSWSCESCDNWRTTHALETCATCYWHGDAEYVHVALREERQMSLKWVAEEVAIYDRMREDAAAAGTPLPEHAKGLIARRYAR
jgi:hypothetical protein